MKQRYFEKFIPKKSWLDANGDGDVDYQDFIAAAQKTLNAVTPTKNALDINGDGVVDINDALDAARITGATIAGVGATLGVGAVAGGVLVTGKATAIASVVASSLGGAAGAAAGTIFGTTTAVSWAGVQLASGSWILATKTVVTTSPAFVTAISSIGSVATSASSGIVNTIAGFPVVKSLALISLNASKQTVVIAGMPIATNFALAAGLIAVVVVGGYAYYVLTRKRIEKSEVEEILREPPEMA
ncbi:MAG: hypothetical protein P8Q23_11945 [Paracoccaceae bacterium]|nr:hypothetical protein [Paracoccaceae bacterium]